MSASQTVGSFFSLASLDITEYRQLSLYGPLSVSHVAISFVSHAFFSVMMYRQFV